MDGPDLEQATDAILGQFLTYWNANVAAVNGGVIPAIEWSDDPQVETPLSMGTVPWVRATVRHTTRMATTIGRGRSESMGIVRINIFVQAGKRGLVEAARLGNVALAAFEGQRVDQYGIWFSDTVAKEAGVDHGWYTLNVSSTFHYYNNR